MPAPPRHWRLRRAFALRRTRECVTRHTHDQYAFEGPLHPRVVFTRGLGSRVGLELVMAGGADLSTSEVGSLVRRVAGRIGRHPDLTTWIDLGPVGRVRLGACDPSWIRRLTLGSSDPDSPVETRQIVPEDSLRTIDVPALDRPWCPVTEPIWARLDDQWPFTVPRRSTVETDLDALHGDRVTYISRREHDRWGMFCRPIRAVDEVRTVPLQTLLGADPSLSVALALDVGQELQRPRSDAGWPVLPRSRPLDGPVVGTGAGARLGVSSGGDPRGP